MPIGKLMAYEPDSPLGIIESQGAVVFLDSRATGGRSALGFLYSSARKSMKVAPSTITSRFPARWLATAFPLLPSRLGGSA